MECVIVSPKAFRTFEKVERITLRAKTGEMEICPGHAETFALLSAGRMIIKSIEKNEEEGIDVEEGVAYVRDDRTIIIL